MSFWSKATIYFLIIYLTAGLAMNIGYHRFLSHRSIELPKWFQYLIVGLGLPAGTPIQWAGTHRFHHAHTDVPEDPHSPHHRGFWYAHVGWYISSNKKWVCILYSLLGPLRTLFDGWYRPRTNQEHNHLAKDVSGDPFYRWVSRPAVYFFMCWLHIFIFLTVAIAWMGWIGLAVAWFTYVTIYNLGDSIDSWAHIIGQRPFKDSHLAGNHWILGLLILGDGWHANHHSFPASAKHGLMKGQFDWTWKVIQILEKLGIAKNPVVPTQEMIQQRLIQNSRG